MEQQPQGKRVAAGGEWSADGDATFPWRLALSATLAGLAVAFLRLLGASGFSNDHFFYLSRASQFLTGARPVRDFVDPGFPLQWALSAGVQAIGGQTLLPEAILVAAAYGVSAALTLWMLTRWHLPAWLALWAVFVEVAVLPRTYSYPKVLAYVIAALAILHYARKPSTKGLLSLSFVAVIAFLFRHDHGLYVGAAVCLIVAAPVLGQPRLVARRMMTLVGTVALALAPYLGYVAASGGLTGYFAAGVHFSEREAGRTLVAWPWVGDGPMWSVEGLSALAFYALWITPILALAMAWNARGLDRPSRWTVTALVVMAACVNAGFLRDPLTYRVSDAVVPFALLGAWIASRAWNVGGDGTTSRRLARGTAVVFALVIAAAAAKIGNLPETLKRAELVRLPPRPQARWDTVVTELRDRYAERQMPSDLSFALVPFYRYLDACTPPEARILVTGFAPEVAYYARRGFAGGHPSLYRGYYSSDRDQREIVERLERELVLFVVASPEGVEQFASSFPLVNAFVSAHFVPLSDFAVDGVSVPARVYVHRGFASAQQFEGTAWPCPGAHL